jgi:putative membrane protein
MMRFLTRFFTVVLALFIAAHLVTGIDVEGFYTALVVAVILAVLNVLVRPVLIILTLPITILTLGLFVWILNAFLFWFVGTFVDGFTVQGFIPALLGSLIIAIMSWIAHKLT